MIVGEMFIITLSLYYY